MTTLTVTSTDGTTIGYQQCGSGPGVLLVHGSVEHAASHRELAEALSGDFTVTFHDRRGRGASGAFGDHYGMHTEVEDVEALLAATGAELVFGVSSGALIALEAAMTLPAVRKVVAYEPALVDAAFDLSFVARHERLLADGDVVGAMLTSMKGAQMGPPALNRIPDWMLRPLVRLGMRAEERKAKPDDFTMRKAAPTVARDFQLVRETAGAVERYANVRADVLLLGGARSPRYLIDALDALERVLPSVCRKEFARLGHGGSGNADRGGDPATVARELRAFLALLPRE